MKILLVSNFYYNRGGDCTYLFSLKNLLEKKGHDISIFSMNHPLNFESEYSQYFVSYINYDEEVKKPSLSGGLKVLNRSIYSQEAVEKIEAIIKVEKPDVAHLQNIHHHITPSIFKVLKKYGIPIIWTLHDFSVICPNTSFLANGIICEKCKKSKYYWPVLIKCKKNSIGASLIASFESSIHRILKLYDQVDYFIAPSEFLKNKLVEYGFNEERIIKLNNFMCDFDFSIKERKDDADNYLYVGRISWEKGIKTLIDAAIKASSNVSWQYKLKIVGSGPLENEMKDYAKSKDKHGVVEFLGYKSQQDVIKLIGQSLFTILPSECYENFPYSLLETFSLGNPAIGSRLGGIPEIIRNWETGLLFDPGDSEDLSLKISFFLNHPDIAEKMGRNAQAIISQEMNADQYYEKLLLVYKRALSVTVTG